LSFYYQFVMTCLPVPAYLSTKLDHSHATHTTCFLFVSICDCHARKIVFLNLLTGENTSVLKWRQSHYGYYLSQEFFKTKKDPLISGKLCICHIPMQHVLPSSTTTGHLRNVEKIDRIAEQNLCKSSTKPVYSS